MSITSRAVLTGWISVKSVGLVAAAAAIITSAALVVAHGGSSTSGTVTVAKNAVFATNHQPFTTPSADVRAGGADMNGAAAPTPPGS
jgi:hypothetical protein